MAVLTQTRKRLRATALVLGAASALMAAYLVSPLSTGQPSRMKDLGEKQKEARNLEAQVKPLRDMPNLLVRAQVDIDKFYKDRLTGRYSSIQDELGKLAAKNGVTLSDAKYDTFALEGASDLQAVAMSATLEGSYANLIKFVNSVERSKLFFLVDAIQLADQKNNSTVRLSIQMESYLRPRSTEDFKAEDKKAKKSGD
ncbi:MAG: hypothetical protein HYX26_04190 [Acidobacteriales bacterium]|nr:hypothetical protein [Terriglobales bacterium]